MNRYKLDEKKIINEYNTFKNFSEEMFFSRSLICKWRENGISDKEIMKYKLSNYILDENRKDCDASSDK